MQVRMFAHEGCRDFHDCIYYHYNKYVRGQNIQFSC